MLGLLGGTVFDPINGIEGKCKDIWIKDGKVAAPEEIDMTKARTIDVSGQVVMPGGVDIHSHVAGAKVNSGRKLCPEDSLKLLRPRTPISRSGSGYTVPSTHATGYLYSEMGYTTVMEAAAAPLVARHTHEELEDVPNLDKGVFITLGNNHFIMKCIRDNEYEKARDYVGWLMQAVKGFAIKIVNPGGVENWKFGKNTHNLDDEVIDFGVTPRQILTLLGRINTELKMPHPTHIHGLRLGQAGNVDITIETMDLMNQFNAHFCHVQFMSYGGERGKMPISAGPQMAEAINERDGITVDIGQIVFGPATTMTSDGPAQFSLHQKIGGKWVNDDLESESGGGVVPLNFKRNNPLHGTMWVTGMEIFLLVEDPWKVFLTTDHPNAGPFLGYPQVIRLLMDSDYRTKEFERLHGKAKEGVILPELKREYSLNEIAIITRAGPARRLGLKKKGHLAPGADADIAIYSPADDKEEMFAHPSWVIKDGEVVVKDGQLARELPGRTMYVSPDFDPKIEKDIRDHFKEFYTINYENFPIDSIHMGPVEKILCS